MFALATVRSSQTYNLSDTCDKSVLGHLARPLHQFGLTLGAGLDTLGLLPFLVNPLHSREILPMEQFPAPLRKARIRGQHGDAGSAGAFRERFVAAAPEND